MVVERNNELRIYTRNPDELPTVVDREQVVSVEPVEISQMPPGLINSSNPDELRDLMAYFQAAGNEDDEIYIKEEESEENSGENTEATSD